MEQFSATSISVTELHNSENAPGFFSPISRCMKSIRQEMSLFRRIWRNVWKAACLVIVFYVFTCSLDLLSRGFCLLGLKPTGENLRKEANLQYLENPVFGLMVGILITVLLHSSSTSTSIVVAMVGAGILNVTKAIPIIMGANIGTSITTSVSTIISFPKAGEAEQFRLAFSCATLHSMFNWCSVVVLIATEHFTGYLEHASLNMTQKMTELCHTSEINFLNIITKPAVNLIVEIDTEALKCYYSKPNCSQHSSLIAGKNSNQSQGFSLFQDTTKDDSTAGLIILAVAVISVVSCLLLNVKILKSILQGEFAKKLATQLNAEIAFVPWLTEYLAILFGTVVTILIQSSSVFTSTIAPLVGLEFLSLKRAYPLTLGANIGTTTTALMTALAARSSEATDAGIQIALCHVLFNLTGALIFYPIPYMRFPIKMAVYLGQRTAMYRWFAVVFMALMFVIVPAIFMGLCSLSTSEILVVLVAVMMVTIFLFITCINEMRAKCPVVLPELYLSWKWLPIWIRSLEPYDQFIKTCCSQAAQSSSRTLPVFNARITNMECATTGITGNEQENINITTEVTGLEIPVAPRRTRRTKQLVEGNNNLAFVKEELKTCVK